LSFAVGGKCIKVDNGGALNYRALGKLKTNFGDKVDELVTLTDGRNSVSSYFYGDMSKQALINSFNKVTSISDAAIKEVVKDEQLAQILINRRKYMQRILNEIESTPYDETNLAAYLKKCAENVQQKEKDFLDNWNQVLERIKGAEYKPEMYGWGVKNIYESLNTECKVLASYIAEGFSDATNNYLRLGAENNRAYTFWASHGLDYVSIPRYRDALKYAMDGLHSRAGITYRWQPAGSFAKDFKVYQLGAEAPQPIVAKKSNGLFAKLAEARQKDDIGVPKDSPIYMSLKRRKYEQRKETPKEGDIVEIPNFVSSGQKLKGLEEFRRRLYYESDYTHPELIVIKGKKGKIIPSELCGFRSYEEEVLYKADTKYRYIGEKEINKPADLEGFEQIIETNEKNHWFGFKPFKMIMVEEI